MMWVIIPIIIGLIPAYIASTKGRSFGGWYLYGVLLFAIALIHSLCIKGAKTKNCPECVSKVDEEALVCKYCKYKFTKEDFKALSIKREKESKDNNTTYVILTIIGVVIYVLFWTIPK